MAEAFLIQAKLINSPSQFNVCATSVKQSPQRHFENGLPYFNNEQADVFFISNLPAFCSVFIPGDS